MKSKALIITILIIGGSVLGLQISASNSNHILDPSNTASNSVSGDIVINAMNYTVASPLSALNDIQFDALNATYNFPGNGSKANPFIIEGLNITFGFNELIELENVNYYIIIRNNLLDGILGFYYGIELRYTNNVMIYNNTIARASYGVYMYFSYNNTISENNIYRTSNQALYGYYSDNIVISDNSFRDSTAEGIYLYRSSIFNITDNTIENNEYGSGIYINAIVGMSYRNNISGNTILSVQYYGIYVSQDNNNTISGNYIGTSGYYSAIYLSYSANNTITFNQMENGGLAFGGLGGRGNIGDLNSILQTQVSDNFVGEKPVVYYQNTDNISITSTNVVADYPAQILIINGSNLEIYNMMFYDVEIAISIYYGTSILIYDNMFYNLGKAGVELSYSIDAQILGNTFDYVEGGITLSSVNSTVINENQFMDIGDNGGLALSFVDDIDFSRNSIINSNWIGIGGSSVSFSTFTDNFLYQIDSSGIEMSGLLNVTIDNNIITDVVEGMYLYTGVNNTISNNFIVGVFGEGIYLEMIDTSTFLNNFISDVGQTGMYLADVVGSLFMNNRVSSDSDALFITYFGYGALSTNVINPNFVPQSDTEFYDNDFFGVMDGVAYSDVTGDIFSGNFFSDWDGVGIYEIDGGDAFDDSPSPVPNNVVPEYSISNSGDITYTVGATGNDIFWTPNYDNINYYWLYQDDILIDSNVYWGGSITLEVDGLGQGAHTFILSMVGFNQELILNTIVVTVVSGTPTVTTVVSTITENFTSVITTEVTTEVTTEITTVITTSVNQTTNNQTASDNVGYNLGSSLVFLISTFVLINITRKKMKTN